MRCYQLPLFTSSRIAKVVLTMAVVFGDAQKEIAEFVLRHFDWSQDKTPVFERELDGGVMIETKIAGESFGDPHREAVSPFLNLGFHTTSVSTMKIHQVSDFGKMKTAKH